VLGTFPDGSPAVTAHTVGPGVAIQIGTVPSLHYHQTRDDACRTAISTLFGAGTQSQIATFRHPQPGLITRPGRLADDRRGIIALNWTGTPQQVEISETSIAVSSSHAVAHRWPVNAGEQISLPSGSALLVLSQNDPPR